MCMQDVEDVKKEVFSAIIIHESKNIIKRLSFGAKYKYSSMEGWESSDKNFNNKKTFKPMIKIVFI